MLVQIQTVTLQPTLLTESFVEYLPSSICYAWEQHCQHTFDKEGKPLFCWRYGKLTPRPGIAHVGWICGLGAEAKFCVTVAHNSDQAKYRALRGFDTAVIHLLFLHRTVRFQLFVENVASTLCLLLASSQRTQYI